jgi:hypothetical protein
MKHVVLASPSPEAADAAAAAAIVEEREEVGTKVALVSDWWRAIKRACTGQARLVSFQQMRGGV